MRSTTRLLIGAALLFLVVSNTGVAAYTYAEAGVRHMRTSRMMGELSLVAETLGNMRRVGGAVDPTVLLDVSNGEQLNVHRLNSILKDFLRDRDRPWKNDGIPLENYPDHDHLRYQNEEGLEEFGAIPDGDLTKLPREEQEALKAVGGPSGQVLLELEAQAGNQACMCLQKKVGGYDGTQWGEFRRCADWDNSGFEWCYVKDPVACGRTQKVYESTQHRGRFWTKCDASQIQKKCLPASGSAEDKILSDLGVPKDGMYEHDGTFFRWNSEVEHWEANSRRSLTRGWQSVATYRGGTGHAKSMAARLKEHRPRPIGPADALEVFTCDNGRHFTYDAGVLVTELYFQYHPKSRTWTWSPDRQNWMPTSTHVVDGGHWNGKMPVQDNKDLIDALEVYTITGKANLPSTFGETWFTKAVRLAWRVANGEIIKAIVKTKEKIDKFKKDIENIKWSDIQAKLSRVIREMARIGGRVIWAVLYGLLNGVLMGMLDAIGDAASSCPNMQAAIAGIKLAWQNVGAAVINYFLNLNIYTALPGLRDVGEALMNLVKALFNLVWGCPGLKLMLGIMIVVIVVALIANAVLVATGYGAVFKVVMALVGLVFAVPFLIGKVVSIGKHVIGFVQTTGRAREDHVIGAIEDYASIVGCVLGLIFLLKSLKNDGPQAMAELSNSKLGRFFGLTPKDAAAGGSKVGELGSAIAAAENGNKPAVGGLIRAGGAGDDAARAGSSVADDAARAGAGVTDDAARAGSVTDDAARAGSVTDDAARGGGGIVGRARELMKRMSDNLKRLFKRRQKNPDMILGSADDLARAKALYAVDDAGKLTPAGKAAMADDMARIAQGKKPAWAGPEPGGIVGPGPPQQTIFWDKAAKCWRHGPNSLDPMYGAGKINPATGLIDDSTRLAGKPVGTTFDKFAGKDRPALDICKVAPYFCASNKQGVRPFCVQNPTLCGDGVRGAPPGVLGMPRQRMPQIADEEAFLRFLSEAAGRTVKAPPKTISPSTVTPTQAEISLLKTQGLGDAIAAGKGPKDLARVLVSRDGFIIDGHHRWSAFKWAEMNGGSSAMKIRQVDMDIADIIKAALKLYKDGKSLSPDILTFAGLLQLHESYGPEAHASEAAAKAAWVEDRLKILAAAGLAPQHENDLHELWQLSEHTTLW